MSNSPFPPPSEEESTLETGLKPPSIRPQELLDALLADELGSEQSNPDVTPLPTRVLPPVSIGRPADLPRPTPSTDDEIDALLEAALPSVPGMGASSLPPTSASSSTQSRESLPSLEPATLVRGDRLPWPVGAAVDALPHSAISEEDPEKGAYQSGPDSASVFPEEALTLKRTSRPPPLPRASLKPKDDVLIAKTRIEQGGHRESWEERAAWLEQQAYATSDPKARARLLVVASEAWALLGETSRARKLSGQAQAASPILPFVSRQNRWLAAHDRDWKSVLTLLDFEIRAGLHVATKTHAAYYAYEIQRVILRDEAQAAKKLEILKRLDPMDWRHKSLMGLDKLEPHKGPLGNPDPQNDTLETAHVLMWQARGRLEGSDTSDSVPVLFQEAARALAERRLERVTHLLQRLRQREEELSPAAAWLSVYLLAAARAPKEAQLEALSRLVEHHRTPVALRAWVERCLALGALEEIGLWLTTNEASQVLPVHEILALSALCSRATKPAGFVVEQARQDGHLLPLLAAVSQVSRDLTACEKTYAGSAGSAWGSMVAHALAAPPEHQDNDFLSPLFAAGRVPEESKTLSSVLCREHLLRQRERYAELLENLMSEARQAEDSAARLLAVGLLQELAGAREQARACYQAVLKAEPQNHGVARALLDDADSEEGARILLELGRATHDLTLRALLITEAAVRLGEQNVAYEHLLDEANEADSGMPFAWALRLRKACSGSDRSLIATLFQQAGQKAPNPHARDLYGLMHAWVRTELDAEEARSSFSDYRANWPHDSGLTWAALDLEKRDLARAAEAWRAVAERQGEGSLWGVVAALLHSALGDPEKALDCLAVTANDSFTSFLRQELRSRAWDPERFLAERPVRPGEGKEREPGEEHWQAALLFEAHRTPVQATSEYHALLEMQPNHQVALHRVRKAALESFDPATLTSISLRLAEIVGGDLVLGYAWFAAHLSTVVNLPLASRAPAELAFLHSERPLWAARRLYWLERTSTLPDVSAITSQATNSYDQSSLLRLLSERAENPLDKATLLLRRAELEYEKNQVDSALELIQAGLSEVPSHYLLLAKKAELLERLGRYPIAAETWEELARGCNSPEQEQRAWRRAAMVWLDQAGNPARAVTALESAFSLAPTDRDTFARLVTLHREALDYQRLRELFEQRLLTELNADERALLEVERARAMAQGGETEEAIAAIQHLLEQFPHQVEALGLYAELSAKAKNFTAAENAWLRSVARLPTPLEQAEVYLKLGLLYENDLPNPERAETALNEVLKRKPSDARALAALARVYSRLGQAERAIKLANSLLEQSENEEERLSRTLALARLTEADNARKAETILERARQKWPHAPEPLRATVEFYRRQGAEAQANRALTNALVDARRAIAAGRLDGGSFEILATAADLREDSTLSRASRATLSAIEAERDLLRGVGLKALDASFDDLLAPDGLGASLRELLLHVGPALELAFPLDTNTLRAEAPEPSSSEIEEEVRHLSAELGVNTPRLLVSPVLGAVCMPSWQEEPVFVFGKALELADPRVRSFLLTRSFKLLISKSAVLTRLAAIEQRPVMAALLSTLVPGYQPKEVDPSRVANHVARLSPHLGEVSEACRQMADDVSTKLDARANALGASAQHWANRATFLAGGDLFAALEAVALAHGQHAIMALGREARLRFLARNPEARDLVSFAVSDPYIQALNRP